MYTHKKEAPMEIIDPFTWEDRFKIITRDIHGISGLMNFTHLRTISSTSSTPWHFHRNIIEIHCIVKGCRHNLLNIDGREEDYVYTGGEAFVVFPGEYHSTGSDSRQAPCEVFSVQLNLSEGHDFLGLNPQKGNDLCSRFSTPKLRHLRTNPEDLSLLRQAFNLFSTHDPQDRDEGLMHLLCFLHRLLKLPPAHLPLQSTSDASIQKVINYIHENITEPLQLETLAKLTGYSLSRFKTKFREETGQTPAFYISSMKIDLAKKVLLDSDQSITDIAYNLGWSSGNYFCTVFKKLTGISPLQYRKNNS